MNVRIGGKTLPDLVRLNIAEAYRFFDALDLTPEESAIADKVLVEIRQRLKFLNDVGLNYLSLDRSADTYSAVETIKTRPGSKTMGLDPKTHRLFLPAVEYKAADPAAPKARPTPTPYFDLRSEIATAAERQESETAENSRDRLRVGLEDSVRHHLKPLRHAWVQVAEGEVALNGQTLKAGDGAALSQEEAVDLVSAKPAQVLIFDLN